jgi:hypothetical protein
MIKSFNLSAAACELVEARAKKKGVSQSKYVELLITTAKDLEKSSEDTSNAAPKKHDGRFKQGHKTSSAVRAKLAKAVRLRMQSPAARLRRRATGTFLVSPTWTAEMPTSTYKSLLRPRNTPVFFSLTPQFWLIWTAVISSHWFLAASRFLGTWKVAQMRINGQLLKS